MIGGQINSYFSRNNYETGIKLEVYQWIIIPSRNISKNINYNQISQSAILKMLIPEEKVKLAQSWMINFKDNYKC